MAEQTQSYKNHTRFLPPFHFFIMPVMLVNFLNAGRHVFQQASSTTCGSSCLPSASSPSPCSRASRR